MLRMIHRDQVLISHQLPLLQLMIFGIARLTNSYVVTQCAMAVIGAAVGASFYLLARDLVDERAAFLAALLLATNPFMAAFSTVPFQEPVMLLTLLLAFHYFYAKNALASSFWLGLACLTRFEAWGAAPVLALAYAWPYLKQRRVWPVLRGLLLFGWAPAAWIVFRHGLSPPGSLGIVEAHFTLERFMRWVYLGYITAKFTPIIVIALGLWGAWLVWTRRDVYFWPLILYFGIFVVAILFSAHGDWPDPERRVNSRSAHLWIAAVLLLAAIALESMPRYSVALTVAGVLFGLWGSYMYVQRETSDPEVLLSYRLAKFLDASFQPRQRALVLAPPWPAYVSDFYLKRARETGGEEGYRAAVRNLAESDLSPPAYQRTLIHSRFDRDRWLWNPGPCTEWVAVWSDYASPPPDLPAPEVVLRAGDRSVRVSKRTCPM